MRDLTSWLTYISQQHPQESVLGLERITPLARELDLLSFNCPVVTVAGTNGKGSCVTLLESILLAQGYRVSTYTSPHLLAYNERVRINGVMATDTELCESFAAIEILRNNAILTFFEFATLAAFYLFKQQQLDVIILEIGLGGRLDAVNIIDADIAVLTTIALDHTDQLGDDREKIGWEKAGIMRTGKPAVCGDFTPPQSVHTHAEKIGAPLFCQNQEFGYKFSTNKTWDWWSQQQTLNNLPTPKIELQNAATALMAIELLAKKITISRQAIIQGLRNVFIPGRLQTINSPIPTILDVAHNPAAAVWLAKQLKILPCTGKTLAVIGMLKDKDQLNTVKELLDQITAWYVAGLDVPRGGPAADLAKCLQSTGAKQITEYATVTAAYTAAIAAADNKDRIIVFGSFHTVSEVMKIKHD